MSAMFDALEAQKIIAGTSPCCRRAGIAENCWPRRGMNRAAAPTAAK
jgi:hypothetical protein